MSKIIRGWNDIPEGYVQEEDFHLAPLWLRALARTRFLEKYAYPMAIKRGLVRRWKIEPEENGPEFSWLDGIQYMNSQYPGYSYGSPIEFQMKKTPIKIPFFLMQAYAFLQMFKSFLSAVIGGIFATRWGRARKTTYMKQKILTAKN